MRVVYEVSLLLNDFGLQHLLILFYIIHIFAYWLTLEENRGYTDTALCAQVYSIIFFLSSQDPMDNLIAFFYLLVIIPSAIMHEYMHGWVADRLGDPTARYAGRLTLNPKSHIDLWGTIILPIFLYLSTGGRFLFAYAKPVPYNPYNLKNQKTGPMWVALAGPLSNLFLAFLFSMVIRVLPISDMTLFFSIIVYANIGLAVFNLLPIPPLDGSKVLYAILPDSLWKVKEILERYGFMILIAFILFFSGFISPVVQYIFQLFVGSKVLM